MPEWYDLAKLSSYVILSVAKDLKILHFVQNDITANRFSPFKMMPPQAAWVSDY